MTALIHILGSDIPHHNQTVLRFFNDELAPGNPDAREFMVAGQDKGLSEAFPALTLRFWPDKAALAKAVIAKAKANRQQRFFSTGSSIPACGWPCSAGNQTFPVQLAYLGADLYEVSRGWKFRLFYPLRRMAQGRVGCVFATRGDLNYFAKQHPNVRGELIYFPTRMDPALNTPANDTVREGKLTILVGNSGDRSNEHVAALRAVHQQFGDTVNVVVPMGYPANNDAYINEVRQQGLTLLALRIFKSSMKSWRLMNTLRC